MKFSSLFRLAVILLVLPAAAGAEVPGLVNYQGKLTTPEGNLVPDGLYRMTFRLYQDDSVLVWTESFDGESRIQVTDGLFNVQLGSGDNDGELAEIFRENDALFLGITLGEAVEMTPRLELASAGYAFRAGGSLADNPVGMIQMYSGPTVPSGWLLCDGAEVSRDTYADLFAVIGTIYGPGDGSATFNLPDLSDRFARGSSGSLSLGQSGGTETIDLAHSHNVDSHSHSISTAGLNHRHSFSFTSSSSTHSHYINKDIYSIIGPDIDSGRTDGSTHTVGSESHGHRLQVMVGGGSHNHGSGTVYTGYSDLSHDHGGNTGSAAPGTDSRLSSDQSVLPPYQAVNFIIKY